MQRRGASNVDVCGSQTMAVMLFCIRCFVGSVRVHSKELGQCMKYEQRLRRSKVSATPAPQTQWTYDIIDSLLLDLLLFTPSKKKGHRSQKISKDFFKVELEST